jgi:two-component system, OmpR family, heavy metal sensor histidine kinase CusS
MIRSLRLRLLVQTSLAAAVILSLLGFALYFSVQQSTNSEFNQTLLTEARAVGGTAEEHEGKIVFDFDPDELPKFFTRDRPDYYQAWIDPDVVLRSTTLGSGDLPRPLAARGISYVDGILPDGRPGRFIEMSFETAIESNAGGDSANSDKPRGVLLTVATDTISLQDSLDNFRWILIGLCSLAVVVSGAVLYWVVGRGVRPVERLAADIDRMQETDLSARLHAPDAPTELAPVVEKLNGLLSRVAAAFSRERAFTADVAHELRSPLAALLTTFEVCRTRSRDEAAYIIAIDRSREVARQMQDMVETLLILARADSGQLSLAMKNTDFADFLDDCWALFKPRAETRGLKVEWNVPGPIFIDTDPEKLRIILHNIFDNAVSYADNGGTIHVAAQVKKDRLQLEVSNTGSLIPPDKTAQLFDRFWRGDQARSQTGVHCGLGLSLCQRLSRLLKGQIEIESTAQKLFIVRLSLPTTSRQASGDSPISASPQGPSAQGPREVESAGASSAK